MATLRVLSWNIRTLGSHPLTTPVLGSIVEIILNSKADIVCIQELQIGRDVVGEVGAPISQSSFDVIERIYSGLNKKVPGANWWWACSGVDSGISDSMRDAYAFLFKQTPNTSKDDYCHIDAPDKIEDLCEPVILRQPGVDHFPGRRPGMFTVKVTAAKTEIPVNIISYHACTPCNTFSKGNGAGFGINALATLLEIGGGMYKSDGHKSVYSSLNPLPQIDTIVLGDFNYSMDQNWAKFTYYNLLLNYTACISTLDKAQLTTYSPDSTKTFKLISAYDNIFLLSKHDDFKPALSYKKSSGVIDFIAEEIKNLGPLHDLTVEDIWFTLHQDAYGRQYATEGISDHIPVWADFTISGKDTTASQIKLTCGSANNCLFHAIFGTSDANGMYIDADAVAHRQALMTGLRNVLVNSFPSDAFRSAVLHSMLEEFNADPDARNSLAWLIANADQNPFDSIGFPELYTRYIASIDTGRMLYVNEAQILACLFAKTVVLHSIDRGKYYEMTFNPGQPKVDIYHQALHFSRWIPQ